MQPVGGEKEKPNDTNHAEDLVLDDQFEEIEKNLLK
jgi:hypothetical protein